MHSVGIDLHRSRSHVAVIDDRGDVLLSRRIINDPETFLTLLAEIEGECRVALEATYGWEWLADVLQDAGYELHLAHPLRTKAIASARVKTDAVDAKTLAHLLRTDLLPEAYIAPRELRDLLRHRVALTRMRAALKNRVGAILAKHGIARPYSDMFGPGGTRFLAELELHEAPRRRLDSTLALIGDFTREIEQTTREIETRAKHDPYVEVLCQIRGVGRYIAMLVIAEVGDITRFATARRLCAWAGMTPTVRSSDMRTRLGHISHQGSPALRWALVEAAQHAATGGGPLRRERASEANQLQKTLEDAGIKLSSVATDVLGVSCRLMLDALVSDTRDPEVLAELAKGTLRKKIPALERALAGEFKPHHTLIVSHILAHLDYLDEAIATLSVEVERRLTPFAHKAELLSTITGVAERNSQVILAELGPDMSRFPSDRHAASWVAICAGNDESAGKRRSGKTRRGNPYLRAALIESAHAAARSKNTYLRAQYEQVKRRRGHKKAIVAVAHSILIAAYHILNDEGPYQDLGGDYFTRRADPDRIAKRLVAQLERLGHTVTLETSTAEVARCSLSVIF